VKKESHFGALLFLALFALPFAATGAVMMYLIGATIVEWIDMSSWQEVPARILEAELVSHHSSKSTSYEVTARYEYEYAERSYEGTRVGIHRKADNIGSYHQRAFEDLARFRDSGEPFRCFVDPAAPRKSVIYRTLRWEMLAFYSVFLFVFGGVGFGLLIGVPIAGRRLKLEASQKELHPDDPWHWNHAWQDGIVRSSNKPRAFWYTTFTLILSALSVPVVITVMTELSRGTKAALIGLVIPLLAVVLGVFALRAIMRVLKYGESVFEMATFPGVIGGRLEGTINTTVNIRPEDGFRVSLRCIKRTTTGSGKHKSTNERILWESTNLVRHELLAKDPTRSAIPVLFAIPYDAKATFDEPRLKIIWRVDVKASVPGVDYFARFDVPVFRTADSSPDFVLPTDEADGGNVVTVPDMTLKEDGVTIERHASGGVRINVPMLRLPGVAAMVAACAAVFGGAGVAMWHAGDAPLILVLAFSGVGLLLLWATLDVLFARSQIQVLHGKVTFVCGIPGATKLHRLSVDEVKRLRISAGMQSGNRVYYRVRLETHDGKEYTLARLLRDKRHAEQLVEVLEAALRG